MNFYVFEYTLDGEKIMVVVRCFNFERARELARLHIPGKELIFSRCISVFADEGLELTIWSGPLVDKEKEKNHD